nr:tetratricopeptide repeat protein [Ardenticatenales bacterium]
LQEELGNKPGIARCLSNLGGLAFVQGDQEGALALTEQSLALRRELGDKLGIGACLGNLGLLHYNRQAYQSARTLYEEGLVVQQELGNKRGIAMGLSNLALVAHAEGAQASATELFYRSLQVNHELGNRREICGCLIGLARLSDEAGRAVRLVAAAQALAEAIGAVFWPAYQRLSEETLADARTQLDEPRFALCWEEGHRLPLEEAIAYALEEAG